MLLFKAVKPQSEDGTVNVYLVGDSRDPVGQIQDCGGGWQIVLRGTEYGPRYARYRDAVDAFGDLGFTEHASWD